MNNKDAQIDSKIGREAVGKIVLAMRRDLVGKNKENGKGLSVFCL
jgi:hypothetical protein